MLLYPAFEQGPHGHLGPRDLEVIGISQELRPELVRLVVGSTFGSLALAFDRDTLDEHDALAR